MSFLQRPSIHIQKLEMGVKPQTVAKHVWRNRFVFFGLALFGLVCLIVLMMEVSTSNGLNPHKFYPDRWASISGTHWLGTDQSGRDVFALLISGAATSFLMSLVSMVSFFIFGTTLGVMTGYLEGWIRGFIDVAFHTFPILLLLLILTIFTDLLFYGHPSNLKFVVLMILFGAFSSPKLADMIRGRILSLKDRAFIESATALGLSHKKIILHHILWHECRVIIFVQCAYMMGQAILMETTLTYLKFGVEYPLISWGLMLRQMQDGFVSTAMALDQYGDLFVCWLGGTKPWFQIERELGVWWGFMRFQPLFPIFAIALSVVLFVEFARYLSDRFRIPQNHS
jgi:peptide/nickel transport system permease protein